MSIEMPIVPARLADANEPALARAEVNGAALEKVRVVSVDALEQALSRVVGDSPAKMMMNVLLRAIVDARELKWDVPWQDVREFFSLGLDQLVEQFASPERFVRARGASVVMEDSKGKYHGRVIDIEEGAVPDIQSNLVQLKTIAAKVIVDFCTPLPLGEDYTKSHGEVVLFSPDHSNITRPTFEAARAFLAERAAIRDQMASKLLGEGGVGETRRLLGTPQSDESR